MMPRAPPFLGGTAGPIVDVDTTAATTATSTTSSGASSGSALLQQRVRVKWKGTGRSQWYSGRIVAYDARKRVHTVVYDDGETHAHHLGDLVWQTLPEHTSSVGSAASSPAAGRGKGAAGGAGRGAGGTPDSLDGHLGTVEGRDLYEHNTDEGYMIIS